MSVWIIANIRDHHGSIIEAILKASMVEYAAVWGTDTISNSWEHSVSLKDQPGNRLEPCSSLSTFPQRHYETAGPVLLWKAMLQLEEAHSYLSIYLPTDVCAHIYIYTCACMYTCGKWSALQGHRAGNFWESMARAEVRSPRRSRSSRPRRS